MGGSDAAFVQTPFELFEHNPLPMYVYDLDTLRLLDANAAAVARYGYAHDEFLALRVTDIWPPESAPRPPAGAARGHRTLQSSGEWRHRCKDGRAFDARVFTQALLYAGRRATLAVVQDLTETAERRRAEEALRQNELLFRALTEHSRGAEDTVRRRAADLEALHGIAKALREARSLGEMYRALVERSMTLFGAAHGALALLNPDRTMFTRVYTTGIADEVTGSTFPVAGTRSGRVVQTSESFVIGEFAGQILPPFMEAALYQALGPFALVPVRSEEEILGTLVVARSRTAENRPFTGADVRLLETIAETGGTAIRRARLYNETERRAAEFASLYDTARDLGTQHDLHAQLEAIVERAADLLHAHGSTLAIYDPQRDDLEMTVAKNAPMPIGTRVPMGHGFLGRLAASREPMRIDDYHSWDGRLPHSERLPLGPLLGVPMLYRGELIGTLDVHEAPASTRRFTDGDTRLLTLFAGQAAAALHNARLFAETEKHLRQVQALHEIDVAISGTFDLRVTLQLFLSKVVEHLGVDAADVLLFRRAAQALEYAAGRGFRSLWAGPHHVPLGGNALNRVIFERTPVVMPDVISMSDFRRAQMFREEGFVAYAAVPLTAKGQVQGVLEVFHRRPLAVSEPWMNLLTILAGQAAIAVENATLVGDLQRANTDLTLAYDRTIEGWSRALDLRDKETEGHSQRVADMAVALAQALGMPDGDLTHLRRGALLHDIGKMSVPDGILGKPGPLTEEEWAIMRRHPVQAYELLSPIEYLRPALDIPYCHHERWDGTGYPRGLREDQIPFAARVFAVVDVWDALRSERPYRPAWSEAETREYLQQHAGTHFDPAVVEAMLELTRGSNSAA
ncbi:MAG TPA: GAF domain-containing protein [bacterium]|nr:GAF domain-containing protein [bacterium]